MPLKIITGPVAEPVSLNEARMHLRIITDSADEAPHPEDAYVASLIAAARQGAEHITGRALMLQTLELALDAFEPVIVLPRPPFVSLSSIQYIDPDGALQTVADGAWQVDGHSEPARLMPPYGESWPATRNQPNAVRIRYQAGYADAKSVPDQFKSWMLLRVGMLYENRESAVIGVLLTELPHVDRLLDAYRVWGA